MTTTAAPSGTDAGARPTGQEPAWVVALRDTINGAFAQVAAGKGAATLAEWRRGLGREPMGEPAMWKHIVPVADRVGDEHAGRRRRVEDAVHYALTLYATHQQSRPEPMHVDDGTSLGAACRRLRDAVGSGEDGIRRRMYAAATADTVEELTGHLRGLVTLLRGAKIPLDYGRLAREIAAWSSVDSRSRIRRAWGRDFEARPSPDATDHTNQSASAAVDEL